jgi:glycosyltransferase involved in cell wall biosynthesis
LPRILRIANRFNLGGPTFNVAYLTKYLAPDYETMLVGGEKDDDEASSSHILDDLGIVPIIIPAMKRELSPGLDLNAYRQVKQLIRDFRPDIVHTHASKAGAIGRQAAFDMKVPAVLHTFHGHVFHSYFGRLKTEFYRQVERGLAKRTDRIIAISDLQKHELHAIHRICPEEKITVVPLGFDLSKFHEGQQAKREAFRREFNVAEDEVAIVIVGRLVPIKDHRLFLRLVKIASERSARKLRFFIVGDGEERNALEAYASQLGIAYIDHLAAQMGARAMLTFTSWRTDVDVVYAGADLVMLTSKNEGTPVSLIEAQASNTAVLSTDVGGVANVVRHEVTGLLADHKDEAGMAEKLLTLIEEDRTRERMAMNGWNEVGEAFHYSRLVRDMDKVYRSLL